MISEGVVPTLTSRALSMTRGTAKRLLHIFVVVSNKAFCWARALLKYSFCRPKAMSSIELAMVLHLSRLGETAGRSIEDLPRGRTGRSRVLPRLIGPAILNRPGASTLRGPSHIA